MFSMWKGNDAFVFPNELKQGLGRRINTGRIVGIVRMSIRVFSCSYMWLDNGLKVDGLATHSSCCLLPWVVFNPHFLQLIMKDLLTIWMPLLAHTFCWYPGSDLYLTTFLSVIMLVPFLFLDICHAFLFLAIWAWSFGLMQPPTPCPFLLQIQQTLTVLAKPTIFCLTTFNHRPATHSLS